jgi:nitrogen fixation/metabolism regulation signal transduction histidine kinase
MYLCKGKLDLNQRVMEDETYFAPAVRTTAEKILKEYELVGSQKFFTEIFGSMTGIGAVIDENRQIVYANDDFLTLLGINTLEPILGKRPGEVVSCIHSAEESSGCGTSLSCAYCGAVNAILESQRTGMKSMKETRISTSVDGKLKSWDLNIISTPVILSGNQFYVLVLQDISDEKRRAVLERIFFHDLLNSLGGLNGLLTILKDGTSPEENSELINLSEETSRDIIEEILLHRQIKAAEIGDLKVNIELTNSFEIIDSAIRKIGFHEAGKNKRIIKAENSVKIDFETDKILLQRVIINLLKNALEATQNDGAVSAGVDDNGEKMRFWVKNDQVIARDIQMQLFQRSFSTKGDGRGIGTYSIKLLVENYLKGKVSFVSNETDGTVISVELNKLFHS